MADIKSISLRPLLFFAWSHEPDGLWWYLSILPRRASPRCRNVPLGRVVSVERVPSFFGGRTLYLWGRG